MIANNKADFKSAEISMPSLLIEREAFLSSTIGAIAEKFQSFWTITVPESLSSGFTGKMSSRSLIEVASPELTSAARPTERIHTSSHRRSLCLPMAPYQDSRTAGYRNTLQRMLCCTLRS